MILGDPLETVGVTAAEQKRQNMQNTEDSDLSLLYNLVVESVAALVVF